MYLKDGREIIESDKYPGYYIDQSNGAWCNERGNYIGGNADDGDKPGKPHSVTQDITPFVYISRTGKQYYPQPTKTATIKISLREAQLKGYRPSAGYQRFVAKYRKRHTQITLSRLKTEQTPIKWKNW